MKNAQNKYALHKWFKIPKSMNIEHLSILELKLRMSNILDSQQYVNRKGNYSRDRFFLKEIKRIREQLNILENTDAN
jgi:hypothetical protein